MKKEEAKAKAKTMYEEIQGGVNEVIKQIRKMIKEGSARRLIIKNKEGEVKFQTNLTLGVGGATIATVMAPVISAIGMFAMFINDYQIIVEKEVIDGDDEYSVDAEFIDIQDEDEQEEESDTKTKKDSDTEEKEKEEKTVGKKK